MFKLGIEPLSHRLKNNKDAHEDYLKKTIENIHGLVERARKQNPSKPLLDSACKFTKHVQKLCGHKWKPIGRFFTIVGNSCPLTRITPTKVVHLKETTSNSGETQKPEIKVYSRRPKQLKSIGSSKKDMIVESKIDNNSEPTHLWGSNATYVPSSSSLVNDRLSRLFSGTVRFRNDQIAKIMRYGDYQLGNVIVSRVYYVEGLGHNLFSLGQFYDADLEVAFRKNNCFIRNLEGVDLLSGSRDTNLYTISLDDMLNTSPISFQRRSCKRHSKAQIQEDHLCSACALGKSKKSSHQHKAEDTNQEKLYLLYIDLCGLMRIESINEKKYILVIVDDYSRFTWIKFLRSKDEAPNAIIKCIKNIQVCLNAIVRNVRTIMELNLSIRLFENFMKMSASRIKHLLPALLNRMALSKDETGLYSGPGLQSMTTATSSSGLVPNPVPQHPFNPPTRNDWDHLFQPMFDEYINPSLSVVSLFPVAAAPRAIEIAGLLSSTTIDQDVPSSSTSSTNQQQQSSIISQGVEEPIPNTLFDDQCHEPLHDVSTSQESSSNV
ncbi:retrovirus-related pol polyprotein from transposon TNT 1-94 [Tanacetum coccineum]